MHTPGPWRAENSETHPNFWCVGPEGGYDVVYLSLRPNEVAANARLIAAAPDMLAALKEAEDFISASHENLSTGDSDNSDARDALKMIRASIAKAEGQS